MTYLGMLFSLSAHSPVREAHRVANHSSLRRPSSSASARSVSSVSCLVHAARSAPPDRVNQPPRLKPSWPSGSWTTPSSEAYVVMTIFPMAVSPSWLMVPVMDTPRHRETGRSLTAQFTPRAVYVHDGERRGTGRRWR